MVCAVDSDPARGTVAVVEWHHAALTCDGSVTRLYLDGELDGIILASGSGEASQRGLTFGALTVGTIAGAAVDVTVPEPLPDGHPLWSAPNVIITPHMADTPTMTAPLLAERISVNTRAFLGDARFVGVVDPARGY